MPSVGAWGGFRGENIRKEAGRKEFRDSHKMGISEYTEAETPRPPDRSDGPQDIPSNLTTSPVGPPAIIGLRLAG